MDDLAGLQLDLGDLSSARTTYQRVLRLRDEQGVLPQDRAYRANLRHLGIVCERLGGAAQAEEYLNRDVRLTSESDDVADQAHSLETLAFLYAQTNRPEEAKANYRKALNFYAKIPYAMGKGTPGARGLATTWDFSLPGRASSRTGKN
ncbi:MAG: tetratricopeptide repeat protein [Arachnia sp.]